MSARCWQCAGQVDVHVTQVPSKQAGANRVAYVMQESQTSGSLADMVPSELLDGVEGCRWAC